MGCITNTHRIIHLNVCSAICHLNDCCWRSCVCWTGIGFNSSGSPACSCWDSCASSSSGRTGFSHTYATFASLGASPSATLLLTEPFLARKMCKFCIASRATSSNVPLTRFAVWTTSSAMCIAPSTAISSISSTASAARTTTSGWCFLSFSFFAISFRIFLNIFALCRSCLKCKRWRAKKANAVNAKTNGKSSIPKKTSMPSGSVE
mmetsp:Transcript_19539/g.44005  ORF Transcript_19539/g.44005 Transcript_19539/m.44005 type:complete len:206 (-) Transcript_19539:965-1582(-)